MIKNIIIVFGIILVFAGIIWIARPGSQYVNGAPAPEALALAGNNFDFGDISMAAGKVSHIFEFKNTGDEPIKIEKMYTSCMCTEASLSLGGKNFGPYGMPGHGFTPGISEMINPGEEASINVVFDPAAHGPAGVGKIERTISVENSAGGPVEIGFSAFVKP